MAWSFSSDRPVYLQIADRIIKSVLSGDYLPGEQIPTVRQLAMEAAVNPNTVQKSFEELERRGVIHSVRCSGWYVNENINAAVDEVRSLRMKKTAEYLAAMTQLGCGADEIIGYLKECQGGNV